jgi:UDP-N-acetylmuramyl pentapeptide synthase
VEIKAHFDNKTALTEFLLHTITDGDVILVKGSRGMKMEEVITILEERFSQKSGT